MSASDTTLCDYCKTRPKWIYRVGAQPICGACCATQLGEVRQENVKLRERIAILEEERLDDADFGRQ